MEEELELVVDNACIAFGSEVLMSGFNMKLARGETACITGQSGCGKTSLLNAIMGFVPLRAGTIKVGGTLLSKSTVDVVRRQVAWIPQELALPFEWVKEMVELPFGLKVNRSARFSEEKLFACFDQLGLDRELYAKRVTEISGGQRQRIMLAVAALLGKPLIIIDEPTSALDADSTDKVLAFFQRQAERGATVLAVSHDKKFAAGCRTVIEL
ncbi:MAG: ABC transporter ATP-binding protein [Mediterranea sp.]|jgi:putative ABC transport system ATP-binding protein|nr:ABC transporter ATP-binding protein [Mediterranea sp.]